MAKVIMCIPLGIGVGVTTAVLALSRALERRGAKVALFDPVGKQSVSLERMGALLSQGKKHELIGEIIDLFSPLLKEAEFVLVEGVKLSHDFPLAQSFNRELSLALNAEVILVAVPEEGERNTLSEQILLVQQRLKLIGREVQGVILNKVPSSDDLNSLPCPILGKIPWNDQMNALRIKDVATYLGADFLHEGEVEMRRVEHIVFAASALGHIFPKIQPGSLIVTTSDRTDVILAVALAALSGIRLAGILLVGKREWIDDAALYFCDMIPKTNLPILWTEGELVETAQVLSTLRENISCEDSERKELIKEFAARYIDETWVEALSSSVGEIKMSPPAFRHFLLRSARALKKRVVLPEGEEVRIIQAAQMAAQMEVAIPILLGNPETIKRLSQGIGVDLHPSIEIYPPEVFVEELISPLIEARKHKGMEEALARELLEDPVIVGMMLLQTGRVDGLVAGVIYPTANVLRPALQIIKTAPDAVLVSSVFFMCLADQVVIYGDCAVNPSPTAEQLAEIAIQSAHSAKQFGIPPRIAMLSYSTGGSGSGADVEKVAKATAMIKEKRPDLLVEGPIQYDAAIAPDVAAQKMGGSKVAGHATVLIFPDLNTGNTTYKAVQRSAGVLCIGPMVQGLRLPVNDLSRGASVEDVLYTIAITAIQGSFYTH